MRFLILLFPLSAQAADAPASGISFGTYLQAGLALAFLVSILFGMAWMARKISSGKGFGQGGMKIIGGVALGPRERIVLVEVGEEWLVIGVVPGQIRTLHRLNKGNTEPAEFSAGGDKPFAQWLKSISERGEKHD